MYGETHKWNGDEIAAEGLSPRVRGNQLAKSYGRDKRGSIPACTGKPHPSRERPSRSMVYPRVYGEIDARDRRALPAGGLSPRVRGNLPLGVCRILQRRSIPACTGKPPSLRSAGDSSRVYPRVYGETQAPCVMRRCQGEAGSIPACTGKPRPHAHASNQAAVYPRVYGETHKVSAQAPRHVLVVGSIPACTGKPDGRSPVARQRRVYPRVYGETTWASRANGDNVSAEGLSPRVRGNPRAGYYVDTTSCVGSIPACTGKPRKRTQKTLRRGRRVYPRVYGETSGRYDYVELSGLPTVYPRVYGETYAHCLVNQPEQGLSPRVRGNPNVSVPYPACQRSIPACTGKPSR